MLIYYFQYPNSWIIDAGANDHMCHQKHIFINLTTLCKPCKVSLPNGESVEVTYSGTVIINRDVVLHKVLYAPSFKYNLLSISKLCRQQKCMVIFTVIFTDEYCFMQAPSMKRLQVLGKSHGGLYLLEHGSSSRDEHSHNLSTFLEHCLTDSKGQRTASSGDRSQFVCNASLQHDNTFVWHARLGHLSFHKLRGLGLLNSSISNDLIKQCSICSKARQQRLPFPHSQIHSTHIFELIHIDLWGPYRVQTYNGYQYFMTIADDYRRSTWTHLITCKSNVLPLIRAFVEMVKTQYHATVQTIRSDNAFELGSSNEAVAFFSSKGIVHQFSCVGTP